MIDIQIVICGHSKSIIKTVSHILLQNAVYYAPSSSGRDAECILKHIVTRYNDLHKYTAFVHDDIFIHNPVWMRWLACLKPSAEYASLSPVNRGKRIVLRKSPGFKRLLDIFNVTRQSIVPASCCGLFVAQRSRIMFHSLSVYKQALQELSNGPVTAFDFEDVLHLLFRNTDSSWLSDKHFNCGIVKYAPINRGVTLSHGYPIRKHMHPDILSWTKKACGVQLDDSRCNNVSFLKPKMQAAPIPTWQECCSVCASTEQCVEWKMINNVCSTDSSETDVRECKGFFLKDAPAMTI